jgi:hypothetical protein
MLIPRFLGYLDLWRIRSLAARSRFAGERGLGETARTRTRVTRAFIAISLTGLWMHAFVSGKTRSFQCRREQVQRAQPSVGDGLAGGLPNRACAHPPISVSGRARRASRRPMRGRHRPCARRAPLSCVLPDIPSLGRIFWRSFGWGQCGSPVVNQNQWAPARAVFVRKYSRPTSLANPSLNRENRSVQGNAFRQSVGVTLCCLRSM